MTEIRKSPSGIFVNVAGGDDKLKVTAADTTPDFLAPKLAPGSGITFTVLNPGGNEQLQIAGDQRLKVTVADTTPDFLIPKVVAGSGITLTVLNPGGNEQLRIAATGGGAIFPVADNVFAVENAADNTKRLVTDLSGQTTGTTLTIRTNNAVSRPFRLPDISGTALVAEDATGQVFIGATVTLFGSAAGIQYSSPVANRSVVRANQFGSHAGIPGITGFKSRGTTIGDSGSALAACVAGDGLFRTTAFGVSGNGTTVNESSIWTLKVASGGVFPFHLASEEELELTRTDGVRAVARKTTSQGELWSAGPLGPGGATGPRWRTGAGTPEGVVVGSVGDLFSDIAGVPNATLYVKESGTATNTGWRAVQPTASSASMYTWGADSVGSTTLTRFLFPGYEEEIAPLSDGIVQIPFPAAAGTLKNLFIRHGDPAGGVGHPIVYTLRKNSVATALTVSLNSTASQGSDINPAHAVTVAQGDVLDIQVTKATPLLASPNRVVASLQVSVP